jgi:hypothetical protein
MFADDSGILISNTNRDEPNLNFNSFHIQISKWFQAILNICIKKGVSKICTN